MTQDDNWMTRTLTTNRIEGLTDCVTSIVMTLMVLDIKLPDPPPALSQQGLAARLLTMYPKFMCFITAFLIVGVFWYIHHQHFSFIRRADKRLSVINLLFMLALTTVPFTTDLMGDYGQHPISLVIFGFNMLVIVVLLYANWLHAVKGGLLDPDLDPRIISTHLQRLRYDVLICLFALVTAFVHTEAGRWAYLLIPLVQLGYKDSRPKPAPESD